MTYQPRIYRDNMQKQGLEAFRVVVKETDLHIQADLELSKIARERVLHCRSILEKYISRFPDFAVTLAPWPGDEPKPALIEDMVQAGRCVGVGPMAAVAGAIAASVGEDLLTWSKEVIVENGGDVFLKTETPVTVSIFTGDASIGSRLGLRTGGGDKAVGICTSSGTIGHSLSRGRSDAVCVISSSCALADAAATAIGNRVRGKADIRRAIEWGREIEAVKGVVVVAGGKVGVWGDVELAAVEGKKG